VTVGTPYVAQIDDSASRWAPSGAQTLKSRSAQALVTLVPSFDELFDPGELAGTLLGALG
jgi:hypothetical protein